MASVGFKRYKTFYGQPGDQGPAPKRSRMGDYVSHTNRSRYRRRYTRSFTNRRGYNRFRRWHPQYKNLSTFTGQNRRMPTGRDKYITLKNVANLSHKFVTSSDSSSHFTPYKVETDNSAELWFPNVNEVSPVDAAKFDFAAGKKLIKVHVYMKDVNMQYFVDDGKKPNEFTYSGQGVSNDTSLYMYSNQNLHDSLASVQWDFLKANGKRIKAPNGSRDFASLMKFKTYALRYMQATISSLRTGDVNDVMIACDVPQRSGNPNNRVNTDFHIAPANIFPKPDVVDSTDKPKVYCTFHATLVTTTTWKLMGNQPR
ncbi:MAG: hypothetical protein [Circular genetic element sp.]|nr:MAG: hypothetical protein [Circular genetic element sp.]